MPSLKIKRGTRAQLASAAAASGLKQGELYHVTDESRIAVGAAADAYKAMMREDDPVVASQIHAATSKATPVDSDELGLSDSAASWGLKKLTFANLAAWVRNIALTGLSTATNAVITASDTVIEALGKLQAQVIAKQNTLVSGTNIKTVNGNSLLGSGDLSVAGGGSLIDSLAITYNGDGAVDTVTEDGLTKTIAYNSDGSVNTVSWPVGSLTRTETYSYTDGVLTGMTATEA